MEEEIIIPEEETFDYNKLRYILNNDGYICHASIGGLILCNLGECTEYIGEIPNGYSTIEEWYDNEIEKINAWKIVDGNLVFDENKYDELKIKWEIEAEENSGASKKYVNDKLKKSTAVVTDELAAETTGSSLIVLNDAGNYEIPYLKANSETEKNIEVVSSNKNILGISGLTTTINGVEIKINADGTVTLNGVATEYIEFDLSGSINNKKMLFLIKNNIDYVMSGLTNNVSLSLYSHDETDRTLVGNYVNELINLSNTFKITHVTLNISNGAEFKNVIIRPQIEVNNVATEFIKHEETRGYGILEDNECSIETLISYKDTTVIMIDKEVECNIGYYRYKYINEKLVEIEINEEEVRTTLAEVNNTINGQNQKIAEVTQTVNELNSKISDIADITTSKESTNGVLEFEGINQSEPIYISIHPIESNIACLYPSNNLYPNDNLYMTARILRFTNTTTKEVFDYELPDDLLIYDSNNYDEFLLDYDTQTVMINKRCCFNADGTIGLLPNKIINSYDFPRIHLTDGDYKIEVLNHNNVYMFVRLMAQNIYTTQFAIKAEVNSQITQTAQDINIGVDKKLENYSTTEEMNSAINVKADSITSSVSRTYATKTENANTLNSAKGYTDSQVTTAKSEIKQTTDSISSEVRKKVGNDEVISKINQSAETVGISANKINLSANDVINLLAGNTINLTSKNISISSDNFIVDKNGKATLKDVTILGGNLDMVSDGSTPTISIKDYAGDEIEIYPSNLNMTWNYFGNTMGAFLQKGGLYIESSNGNYINLNADEGYIEICTDGNTKRITGNS